MKEEEKVSEIDNILNKELENVIEIGYYQLNRFYINQRNYPSYKSRSFSTYSGSFGNCQNFTVNCFKNLIENVKDYNDFKIVIKYLILKNNRTILVADINKYTFEKLLRLIEDKKTIDDIFIMKNEYISTNKSKMVLIMINTLKL